MFAIFYTLLLDILAVLYNIILVLTRYYQKIYYILKTKYKIKNIN